MTVSRFGDEVADGLFRTVLERPSDGLVKGILADRLDEVGEEWKWFAHAMRWCMMTGKCPGVAERDNGEGRMEELGVAWSSDEADDPRWRLSKLMWVILDRAAVVEEFKRMAGIAIYQTVYEAYLALAEGFRQAFAELEA